MTLCIAMIASLRKNAMLKRVLDSGSPSSAASGSMASSSEATSARTMPTIFSGPGMHADERPARSRPSPAARRH